MPTLVAYDRARADEIVRFWTPQQLFDALQQGQFTANLSEEETKELDVLLQAWMHRALGLVTLRDAMWVDSVRGARVYDLICVIVTTQCCHINGNCPPFSILSTCEEWNPQHMRALLDGQEQPDSPHDGSHASQIEDFLQHASAHNLALTCYEGEVAYYPFPENLDNLLPPPPATWAEPSLLFEPPTGWRRTAAIILVLLGVASFGFPLLLGAVPSQPAGLPLGLLTLGLLVGIRAGWVGYTGALCIWTVANLPGFRYGHHVTCLPVLLLLAGLVLLLLDKRLHMAWRWIWCRRNR